MKQSNYINPRHINFWLMIVFIVGVVLRCIHYFGRSSMWFDELTSALNIRDRSFYQLATESLDHNQVAPVGFLQLEKLATIVFGVNDHAYRFFPFVFSIFSLLLLLNISKHFLKGIPLLCTFILFSGSVSAWFYGGEAKQYSGDITAALFLVWAALQMTKDELSKQRTWIISITGFILTLSSLPAIIIAPIVAGIIFIRLLRKKLQISAKKFFIISFGWAMGCALCAIHAKFVISQQVQNDMGAYWSRGFAPLESIPGYFVWLYKTTTEQFSYFLTFWMKDVFTFIAVVAKMLLLLSIPGIVFLIKKHASSVLILYSPFIIATLLASFKILPFENRIAIYATWPFIISGIAGIYALQQWFPLLFNPVIATAVSFFVALPIILITIIVPTEHPPFQAQAAQPVLHELKKQLQPGDILFVYFKARHALNFYGAKEGITEYKVGGNYKTIEGHLRQLDSLKGNKRVWFFFSQWTEKQTFPDSIKAYLGTVIGKEIGKIPDPYGGIEDIEAAAHLYDLSKQQ